MGHNKYFMEYYIPKQKLYANRDIVHKLRMKVNRYV